MNNLEERIVVVWHWHRGVMDALIQRILAAVVGQPAGRGAIC